MRPAAGPSQGGCPLGGKTQEASLGGSFHLLRHFTGAACAIVAASAAIAADATFFPPATPAVPVIETLHGITLTDRYRWLENGKSADVEAWTQQQHAATRAWLDRNAPPVPGLKDELTRLIDRDVTQPPFFKKGREFFLRTLHGESLSAFELLDQELGRRQNPV